MEARRFKQPVSVLVVVYTAQLDVLLLERADFREHWQSVTGSSDWGEPLPLTAVRELKEETGIDASAHGGIVDWHLTQRFEIYRQWSGRYPPGTTHNVEHAFGLEVPRDAPVRLAPREHVRYQWLPWREAAARCFSWTNRAAIETLPTRLSESIRS